MRELPAPPAPTRLVPRRLTPLRLCAASLAGSAVLATLGLADWSTTPPDGPTPRTAPPVPVGRPTAIPADARVRWRPCPDRPALRCGTLRVPVDHRRPHAATLELALAKLPATSPPGRRLGPLLLTPERAGASAVAALTAHPKRYRRLATRYDVVALDPRGSGHSTPVSCLDDRALDAFWATDLTPDTAAEHRRALSAAHAYAAACEAGSGALLRHLATADHVEDLEHVRRALGTSRLSYLGTAHGTRVGQGYARAYPHRVGRFVLDSLEDPRRPAHPTLPTPGTETAGLMRIFTHCVERDPRHCPVGRDVAEAMDTYRSLLADLDRRPVPAPDGRHLTENLARLAALRAAHAPDATGAAFVDGVTEARAGAGGTLLRLADAALGRDARGSYAPEGTVRTLVNCLRPAPGVAGRRAGEPDAPHPRSLRSGAPTRVMAHYLRARCAYNAATSPAGPVDGTAAARAGTPPGMLLLHNVADRVTALADARRAARRLPGAHLVVHHGHGHRVRAVAGRCVRGLVHRFLLDGRLPGAEARCHDTTAPSNPASGEPRPGGAR